MRKVLMKPIGVIPFLHFSIHFFVNIRDESLVQKYKLRIKNKIDVHLEYAYQQNVANRR